MMTADATTAERDSNHDDAAWRAIAAAILRGHNIADHGVERSPHGENVIFYVGRRYALKIFAPTRRQHEREAAALHVARKWSIPTPQLMSTGEYEGNSYILMTRLPGDRLVDRWQKLGPVDQKRMIARIGAALRELHTLTVAAPAALQRDWPAFLDAQAATLIERQRRCNVPTQWLRDLEVYAAERPTLAVGQSVFLHGDLHGGNVLIDATARLTGAIDFADAFFGPPEYDLVAPAVLLAAGRNDLQRALLRAYGYTDGQLTAELRRTLMLHTVFYECSDLMKYARRLNGATMPESLGALERALWAFA
jgi:hygromycin-B 7''-O-kinase